MAVFVEGSPLLPDRSPIGPAPLAPSDADANAEVVADVECGVCSLAAASPACAVSLDELISISPP